MFPLVSKREISDQMVCTLTLNFERVWSITKPFVTLLVYYGTLQACIRASYNSIFQHPHIGFRET